MAQRSFRANISPATNSFKASTTMPKTSSKSNSRPREEKRLRRYRLACPGKLYDRIHRGVTQRLYLIERTEEGPDEMVFSVLGSTGNVYQVTLTHIPTCTCPDFMRKQDVCKHMIFVLTKVVGLGVENRLVYQRAFVTTELEELFDMAKRRRVGGSVLANQRVRESFKNGASSCGGAVCGKDDSASGEPVPRSLLVDCPICFDRLQTLEECTTCLVCNAGFHKDCIRRWTGQQQRSGSPSCPNCRSAWPIEGKSSQVSDEGYVNLGSLQGQSPVRDASTYRRRRYG
ncbi:hypothetical protein MPSEU_000437300 [Mayamaea pseudoterrestris]|nr:hypothetical protein MPSEU_000437300 [Mayamaea pseudoterrestris]